MARKAWAVLRVAVLGVAVLGAGACSSDGDGDPVSATAAESSTTTTAAPEPTTAPAAPSSTSPTPASTPTTRRPTSATAAPTPAPVVRPAALPSPAVTPAPTDPVELGRMADELVAAENALRDPATPDAELAGIARRQQAIYRSLSARPAALAEIGPRIPEALRPVVEANVTAGAELRAMTKPKSELPPWRIIPPPPPAELEGYYREAERLSGVPWAYLASVHLVETRMGRIRGTSTAGAQGPMQFLPATWEAYGAGGDINDPRDAILAAGRYLQRNGAPGDMAKALWNYNHSDRYVRAVTAYARQIEAEPRAYLAYYHWQVYYITPPGDVLLEVGYGA